MRDPASFAILARGTVAGATLALLASACSRNASDGPVGTTPEQPVGRMDLVSSAFTAGGAIPSKYTCEGADSSPPLQWSGVPAGAKSLALVVDDPDAPDPAAPTKVWVHWVLYDLPATLAALGETDAKEGTMGLPPSARSGVNDWNAEGWRGPCPPVGRHRYVHKLYALDTVLGERGALDKKGLERAMAGHVLAVGELTGTYQKSGK